MINLVGGYDSTGFGILVFVLLLGGSILNSFSNIITRAIGIGLFMYGGVLLTGLIEYTIKNTPNLPSLANAFPLLFVFILLLVVFKMLYMPPLFKSDKAIKDNSKENR